MVMGFPMARSTPPAEATISSDLIRALLQEQMPELADLPMEFCGASWDSEIHRVGDAHAVRMPRRAQAAQLIENEQRWLAELGPILPLAVPTPLLRGKPAMGYPWPWSVVPWFDGVVLAHSPPLDQDKLIADLSGFLNALHIRADAHAPINDVRGIPLRDRDETTRINLHECADIDHDRIETLWGELAATPAWGGEPIWVHGDLHPLNLIVRGGRLTAVIDFGDITSGDPATDLAVAWMLFDADGRSEFRNACTIDGRTVDIHTWNRARGWALSLTLTLLAHSDDNPTMHRIATATLNQVLG